MKYISEQEKKTLMELIRVCIDLEYEVRPEVLWLQGAFDRLQRMEGLSGKSETDELVYTKMYAAPPGKASDILKIRFWRTGRHTPSNRALCIALGRALELSEEEMRMLLMAYYDRSDLVFESAPADGDPQKEIYDRRMAVLEGLIGEYVRKLHPMRRRQLNVQKRNLRNNVRHFYYMDARSYLANADYAATEKHIASINYESEFSRQLHLLGEIPRRTMLRHVILFGQPYISRGVVSGYLERLGYLALCEEHTLVGGDRLDRLVIGFLELYEQSCAGLEPEDCTRWLWEAYRYLDHELEARGKNGLRFLYFKTLKR